ncbi:MAG: hypothetical protein ACP5KD_08370 [Fervidobacterium sp.]|jgi:hypothetical protein
MKSINFSLWISIFFSLSTTILYLIEHQYVFSAIIFTFSLTFLSGFREFGKSVLTYRVAHLYVGSILFVIAGVYILLTFLFSLINLLTNNEIYKLSDADLLLIVSSLYSIYNIISLKRAAFKNK